MGVQNVDIHTSFKAGITNSLKDAKDSIFVSKNEIFDIKIPNDFNNINLISDAQDMISNTINLINDAIFKIDSCVNDMENAEIQVLNMKYNELTRNIINDIGGYDEKDKINQNYVLIDVVKVVGINKWVSLNENTKKILLNADYIHKYMEKNNYTYCVLTNGRGDEYATDIREHMHGLNETFEESKCENIQNGVINKGYRNTCCATYVSWVLEDAGLIDKEKYRCGADDLQLVLKNENGWIEIKDEKELEPGDILGYSSHIEIYIGNDENNQKILYNAGSGEWIRDGGPDTRENITGELKPFKVAYRYVGDEQEIES